MIASLLAIASYPYRKEQLYKSKDMPLVSLKVLQNVTHNTLLSSLLLTGPLLLAWHGNRHPSSALEVFIQSRVEKRSTLLCNVIHKEQRT